MAWDLWGPSPPQVELGTTYFPESEWQCDFYFGYGHDVIEENALNEKLCLEVVGRLIAKTDTEIDELEKDLVTLQSELAWAKHEEWSDTCCGALREKIAFLDGSLKNLRNKDENNIEVQSLMHTEPAESIDEIMKDLLRKYVVEKDEQPAKTEIIDSSLESWRIAAGYSDNKKTSSESNSESSRQSEAKGQGPEETETSRMTSNNDQPANTITLNSSSDSLGLAAGFTEKKFTSSSTESSRQCEAKGHGVVPEEKESSCMINNKQPAQTSIMGSSPDSLNLTAGYIDKKTTSSCDSESTRPWEAKGLGFLTEEKEMIPTASSHYEGNRMQNSEVKCVSAKYSTSVSSIDEKTSQESFDSKLIDEVVEHSLIPTADNIGTSQRPDGHESDVSKTVEPPDVIASDSLIYGNGCSSEVKNSCMPILTENGCDEISKQLSTATARSQTLMSSLTPEIKATLQNTKKPACSLVKYGAEDTLRESAGIKKSDECLESRLCALSPTKGDVEQKLIDFVPQTALKVGIKESKMTLGNKIGCPNKSLKTAGNGRNHRQTVKFQGRITDEEDSDQFGTEKETQKDENADLDGKPLLPPLALKPQRPKRKRKLPLTVQNVQETCFPSTEMSSNTTFISKAQKEQKSKVIDDNTRLNQFFGSKQCEKSGHLEQYEDKEHATSLGNSKTSASQLQKKRKRTPSFQFTADTEECTGYLGSKDLHREVQTKRKVTSTLTRPAEVKDLSFLGLQDSHTDATNGSIEEDLKHPEKEDPKVVEAAKSQKQRQMTSTFPHPAESKDLPLGLGLQDLHKDRDTTNGWTEEDPLIVKPYSGDDSQARNLVPYAIPTPIPSLRLKEMTVGQLKELAKRLEVKGFSKLKKMELVELLARKQRGH
ncbi:uncharacterized protein LOC112191512 isoform X2 [Rosa chinensis]|uniref:uncharacterized protein LOC112191512 isoform X2 n=1 Tax=Rosa chinensis TaxID=74649 RepID=UPI000D096EDD|nr:uncharacterized protein LOC112191512 isoform X2 [Rosa chinensis]